MAELFIQISVSLDGFIEDGDGKLDWFVNDAAADAFATETLRSIGAMVFGKTAHAAIADFWQNAEEQEQTPDLPEQARLMRTLPKYVLTHGALELDWENSHAIRAEDLARLKREATRPIAVFAGAAAVRTALAAGVVDEVRIICYPVLLGSGKPLFDGKGDRRELSLVEDRAFESGSVLSRYRVKPTATV